VDDMQGLIAAGTEWWPVIVASLLALVFLGLWLRARAGGGSAEQAKQLKAAQNEVRLLRGDAIQARREHTAERDKLTKELETLRAVNEGKVPPELERWKQRALEAEKRLEGELERHRAEIEKVLAAMGDGGSADQTMISPGGARERVERLEQDLAEARQQLEAATAQYQTELAALTERLNAEKAAALTAQARRHTTELEALQGGRPPGPPPGVRPDDTIAEGGSGLPDSARFPFLQGVKGAGQGVRFYLPYDTATLGRSDANTVVLQETMASRVHAEIGFDGRNFVLTDRNSTNGTLLNEELVTSAPLTFGDLIRIGETELRFTCEGAEAVDGDREFAEAAFRAMLGLAPNCRLALHGLAHVLQQGGREEELRAVAARLEELEGRDGPRGVGNGSELGLSRSSH
jgi:hypothetical protein